MATRIPKTPKTTKTVMLNDRPLVAELHPKDAEIKYTGPEPLFVVQPDADLRTGTLTRSFNWYSRYFDRKMAKEQLALYADYTDRSTLAKQLRRVEEREVMATLGWLARLHMRGLTLTEEEQARLEVEIERLVETLSKPEQTVIVEEKPTSNRPNVQEIMRERAREAAGDFEGQLDEFIMAGAKTANVKVNAVGTLSERNVLPQHISILSEVWRKKLNEFQEVLASSDDQMIEAYSQYTKTQIKAVVKFCEAVLAGLDSYINVKKVARAPRKRKAVSPEKQVAKIKFLKTFEELKLVSMHPSKIIGATEVYCYDSVKRKLWYLVADSHVGTLSVKGATIQGFDASKSGVKTLRKPAEVLKKLLTSGRPASRKVFTEVKSVQALSNGRSNEHLIFLKVY